MKKIFIFFMMLLILSIFSYGASGDIIIWETFNDSSFNNTRFNTTKAGGAGGPTFQELATGLEWNTSLGGADSSKGFSNARIFNIGDIMIVHSYVSYIASVNQFFIISLNTGSNVDDVDVFTGKDYWITPDVWSWSMGDFQPIAGDSYTSTMTRNASGYWLQVNSSNGTISPWRKSKDATTTDAWLGLSMRTGASTHALHAKFTGYLVCDDYCNTTPATAGDTSSPIITFNQKTPADLTTTNLAGEILNMTYNITDATDIDTTATELFYKTNSTTKDWYKVINGTTTTGYNQKYFDYNLSKIWHISLDDTDVLPATYNFDPELMEDLEKSVYSLDSVTEWIKTEFLNMTNDTTTNIIEFMINNSDNSGTQSLPFYYCNSSYTVGNPTTNEYCHNFYNLPAQTPSNHTHTNSFDVWIPLDIIDGHVNSVGVTETGYILANGKSGVNSYDAYYIVNQSRTTASTYSTNNGGSYSELSGTFAMHIHQFTTDETAYFYACANDTLNNYGCSSVETDTFDISILPPNPSTITYPDESGNYNNTVIITYTNATSSFGEIVYYNISLIDKDEVFVEHIKQNNSLNLSFSWGTSTSLDGEYIIRVRAYDNFSQFADGFSINFSIDNAIPSQTWTIPVIANTSTTFVNESFSLSALFTDNNIVFAYNVSIFYPDGTLFITLNKTDLESNSYTFNDSVTPDRLGLYTLKSEVADAHTSLSIADYKYETTADGLIFDFTKDKYAVNIDIVTIKDTTIYTKLEMGANKTADSYKIFWLYDMTLEKRPYIWRKYRVECDGLYLVGNSRYNANFVCFKEKKWIDFENPDIQQTLIKDCGKDCYDVELYMKNSKLVTFESIGDLNIGRVDMEFLVNSRPAGYINILDLQTCPITSTALAFMYMFMFAILFIAWAFFRFILKLGIGCVVVGVGYIFFALSLFACSPIIGIIMTFLGIGIMLEAFNI